MFYILHRHRAKCFYSAPSSSYMFLFCTVLVVHVSILHRPRRTCFYSAPSSSDMFLFCTVIGRNVFLLHRRGGRNNRAFRWSIFYKKIPSIFYSSRLYDKVYEFFLIDLYTYIQMHDTELYDSRHAILSLSSLSSLLSLSTRSTSNIIYLYIWLVFV
jgi:hypothetical protein